MTPSIDTILNDLYKIDPALRSREAELRRVVETFLSHTPNVVPDAAFVERLRRELVPQSSSSSLFHTSMLQLQTFRRPAVMAGGVATLAVLLTVGTLTYQQQSRSPFTTAGIETRSARAFGDLGALSFASAPAQPTDGLGGGGATVSAVAPATQEVGKRIAVDSFIYHPVAYSYTYAGELLALPADSLPVYRRIAIKGDSLSSRVLSEMSRGLIDLSTFGNKTVESVMLHDNEYSINLDYNSGRAAIYPYWPAWAQDNGQAPTQLPSDDALISQANDFLAAHHIDAAAYGAPQVEQTWLRYQGLVTIFSIPQTMSVVYPFRFNDHIVHDMNGFPDGMRVNINLGKGKVEGAWNIIQNSFEASDYALETDANRIQALAEQGGVIKPWVEDGAEKKILKLGTPTVVYIYSPLGNDAQSTEIYIPALQFPVLDRPDVANGTYVPEAVIIPLVKDVLDQAEQQNNNPDRPVMMMKEQ